MNHTPRRVVLLGRVSRGERQQDPESQLAPLRAAAARHGWIVVEEIPLKLSAWDPAAAAEVKRRALAPIVEGRANVLAVWALDRLVRGGIEAAFALLAELEQHLGADLYSLQEPFLSTASADRQTRELMIALLSWVAKWESQRKSERMRAKAQTKRARAEVIGQRGIWGGGAKGGKGGHLASDADIARAVELHTAGRTVRAVAAELGLSKSQVGRMLSRGTPAARGADRDAPQA